MTETEYDSNLDHKEVLISENLKIIERIKLELQQAKSEILIAMAWFTDQELLDILICKAQEGVSVKLKMASGSDNDKLNFTELERAGGNVLSIVGAGYAKMHHKFCVIDQIVALSGSYNWTNNARKNNYENIQVIYNEFIINQLIDTFNKIDANPAIKEDNAYNGIKDENKNQEESTIIRDKSTFNVKSATTSTIEAQLSNTLDQMIAAEIANFDHEKVYNLGYERAKLNNGDHNVIDSALNSLYAAFINDIDVVQSKKERLKERLNEQKELSLNRSDAKLADKTQHLEKNFQIDLNNLSTRIRNLEVEKSQSKIDETNIRNLKIKPIEDHITSIKVQISDLRMANVTPKLQRTRVTFMGIILGLLFIYLLIFYSSAIYILIFAKQDIAILVEKGQSIPPLEVFSPHAFGRLYDKGWYVAIFGFLFALLPITSAMIKLFIHFKKKWQIFLTSIITFIIIDGLIAFKIAMTIDGVNVLQGLIRRGQERGFGATIMSSDFLLVLVLGSVGLIMFHFIFNKILELIDNSSPTFLNHKKDVEIKELENKIETDQNKINEFGEKLNALEKNLLSIEGNLTECRRLLEQLPKTKEQELADTIELNRREIQSISNIINIYQSHIDNDRLPVSETCLDDRINYYYQGWNDFLHDKFSVKLAEEKSSDLGKAIQQWRTTKIANKRILSTQN